jgi:hypothetical protein
MGMSSAGHNVHKFIFQKLLSVFCLGTFHQQSHYTILLRFRLHCCVARVVVFIMLECPMAMSA